MTHDHPAVIHQAHHQAQPLTVRIGRRLAGICSTFAFGPTFLAVTTLYWTGMTLLHGFDPYPFVLFINLISVLAIVNGWLILFTTAYDERLDHAHRENAYHQTAEILELQKQQMDTLNLLDELIDLVEDIHRHATSETEPTP